MAQTLPPSSDPSSPLPRYERKRGGAAKPPRPRFQIADGILAALLSAASLAVFAFTHNGLRDITPLTGLLALTTGATFLLGWRGGGRLGGIIAGSLTAFSLSMAHTSLSWETVLLTLLTVLALFAFACDAAAVACVLAGLAAAVRPDGILLGLVLLAVVSVRTRRLFPISLGAFLGAVLIGGLVHVFALHTPIAVPQFFLSKAALSWLLAPAQTLVVWMLIPLCAELTDPARRPRWLPTALWGVLALLVDVFVHFGDGQNTLLPLMPIVFVLAAGGLTRLMPSLAGEMPSGRYALATAAIVGLLLLRAHAEWAQRPVLGAAAPAVVSPSLPAPAASAPSPLPVIPIQAPAPPQIKALRPIKPLKPALPRAKPAKPPVAKKPVVKPAIALYTLRNGHLVRRTQWAIEWEKTHPQTVP